MNVASGKRPAIFLDRDGTITQEGGYINHPSRLKLIPGVGEAIKSINDAGLYAVVVTNQAGVARGYFKEELIGVVHERLKMLLDKKGARLDAIYYCPHHPRTGPPEYRIACNCRKPATGMIEAACRDLEIDLEHSYMVGDKISDIMFGHKLGLKSVMVMTGYGRGEYEYQRQDWTDKPDHRAKDLRAAAKWILKDYAKRKASAAAQPDLTKLKSLEEMRVMRERLRLEGKRVVFANGCFDVLHGGHVSYLEDARAHGDVLICGVNSDASERGLKGPSRPIYSQNERLEILNAIRFIDFLVLFDEPTCEGLLRELRPDVHAKGTDYTADTVPEREVARELGIEVYIAGPPKENASRGVIAQVQERAAEKPQS